MRFVFYFLTLGTLLWALQAQSDDKSCLNGGSERNSDIIQEIKDSQDPLIAAFHNQTEHPIDVVPANTSLSGGIPMPQAQANAQAPEETHWWDRWLCITCLFRTRCVLEESNSFQDLKAIADYFKNAPKAPEASAKIKKDCLIASLKRDVGSNDTGYSCKNGQPKAFSDGDNKACINQKAVDYLQFAIHEATECMSTPDSPVDPRMVFRMLNNESASHFYVGARGGVGIAQLTSSPVEDIAGWYETQFIDPKTKRVVYQTKENQAGYLTSHYYTLRGLVKKDHVYVDGNASYILQDIASSKNPACAPFKKMAQADLDNPPPSPGKQGNYCSWVSPGEGLAHNLIYAIGYLKYTRDEVIKPFLEKHAPKLAEDQDVLDSLSLVAYGHGGTAAAKSLVTSLRMSNSSNPAAVELKMLQKNDYLGNTQKQMQSMLSKLKPAPYSARDLEGDSCITP